jgi:CRISPR-associated exonuclease Cas4
MASARPKHRGWRLNAAFGRTSGSIGRQARAGMGSLNLCSDKSRESSARRATALCGGGWRCGSAFLAQAMTIDLLAIVTALSAFALIIVWWTRRRRRQRDADTWLPRDLKTAKLAYAERLFRSNGPVRISARVDRAYRDGAGRVTLVELKTRGRDAVYPSDVIELSAQRVALMAATGETVRAHAYVLVQGPNGQGGRSHRVDLLTEAQIRALAERRQALLSGELQARRTRIQGLCDCCAFVKPCRGRG